LVLFRSSPTVFIADPVEAESLWSDRASVAAGTDREMLSPLFGAESVLLADGAAHQRKRKALAPPLQKGSKGTRGSIRNATDSEIDSWPLNRPFALRPRLQAIALNVVLRTVFGVERTRDADLIVRSVDRLLGLVANPFAFIATALPDRIGPLDLHASVARRRRELDVALMAEIRLRRGADLEARHDVLSHLVHIARTVPGSISDAEIRDNVVTLLLAGHETSATGLSWALDFALRDPGARERLRRDARSGDVEGLFAQAVVDEALRLRPPLPIVTRVLTAPREVGPFLLPRGTTVAPCIQLIHRSASYREPDVFNPHRFLGEGGGVGPWRPFGGGDHRCLGASFARQQMTEILMRIFERTELRPASSHHERVRRRGIILAPAQDMRVVMRRRYQ
jgi:cytochrome P450